MFRKMSLSDQLKCIIQVVSSIQEKVKPFDKQTWNRVHQVKVARLANIGSTSKYSTVCKALPEHFKDTEGYHSKCYTNFTATKKVNVPIDETGQCGSAVRIVRLVRML